MKYTLHNGKIVLSESVKTKPEYRGKRKTQGQKAAKELDAATAPAKS